MIRLEDCTVHETTAGVWHYHLVLGEDGDAICGHPKMSLFAKGLPATRHWVPGVKSHIPISHCRECRRLVGDAAGEGHEIPDNVKLETAEFEGEEGEPDDR